MPLSSYVVLSAAALVIVGAALQSCAVEGFNKDTAGSAKKPLKQVFTTHMDNMRGALPEYAEQLERSYMRSILNVVETGNRIPDNWPGTTICVDAVDLERAKKGNKGSYKKLEKQGYFVILTHPDRKDEMKKPFDLASRRIGVFDICDQHIVQAIANGYRLTNMDVTVNIEYVPVKLRTQLERALMERYDAIYLYIMPGSSTEKLVYSQRVYIKGFKNLDISRVNLFYPSLELKRTYMADLYDWRKISAPAALFDKNGSDDIIWAYMYLFEVGEQRNVIPTSPNIERFITQLEVSKEMSDPAYRCYGDLTNENRALCNSSYDPWGQPKEYQTYWDIPCVEDTECPFYKANKNYPNGLGRCMQNGVCELPVGIRRLAYKKYRDEFPYTPMCYGCDPSVADCCKDQKENPKKYPGLQSPDYAFPGDDALRRPRGLQTILPMI